MDPACFLFFTDKTKEGAKKRDIQGAVGCHVDDTIGLGEKVMFDKVVDEIKKKFRYGSHNVPPFKYTGLVIEQTDEFIKIDQDKYMEELEIPNLKNLSTVHKN